MVDSAVNQEPTDLQAILYSKSLPVLSNMLAPSLGEGNANNYKIIGVERARGFSIVKIKITKSVEIDIDSATDDQVRIMEVDYEHHSLQAVLDYFLGKGDIVVADLPTTLDEVNEVLLDKTDKLILDEADIQGYFGADGIVDLYVKDPNDLRWYGNARLKFVAGGVDINDGEDGGEEGEEPGKPDPEVPPTPELTNLVYVSETKTISVSALNANSVIFKVGNSQEVEVAVVGNTATHTLTTGLTVETIISARSGDVTVSYTYLPVVKISNVSFDREDRVIGADLVGVGSIEIRYDNEVISGYVIDNRLVYQFTYPPFGKTLTIIADGEYTVEYKMPDPLHTMHDPSYDPYTNKLYIYVDGANPSDYVQYRNLTNNSSGRFAYVDNVFVVSPNPALKPNDSVFIHSDEATLTYVVSPWLNSISFVTPEDQNINDGEATLELNVVGSPDDIALPPVAYAIHNTSADVVAELVNGNTVNAVGLVDGSTITVKATVVVSGSELTAQRTFTFTANAT